MQSRKYFNKQAQLIGLNIELTVLEAKQIRSALSCLRTTDLGNFGSILQILHDSIPQQWDEE